MAVWQVIFLGLVGGFSAFVPLSTSGCLSIVERLVGAPETGKLMLLIFHAGALTGATVLFRKELAVFFQKNNRRSLYLMLLGVLPFFVLYLALGSLLQSAYQQTLLQGLVLTFGFLITALVLLGAEFFFDKGSKSRKNICWKDVLTIGLVQSLAIVPGVSRLSGALSTTMFLGYKRSYAIQFALLFGVFSVAALVLGDAFLMIGAETVKTDLWTALAGFVASAVGTYIAVGFMLRFRTKGKLRYFAYFQIAIAILLVLDQFVFHQLF